MSIDRVIFGVTKRLIQVGCFAGIELGESEAEAKLKELRGAE